MSEKEESERMETDLLWMEFKLPEVLMSEKVRLSHATIEQEWSSIMRSACQTAAGRALWNHAINDPVAAVLAGESYLHSLYEKIKKDQLNNASEISGVIIAVRTLWFDSRLEAAINSSVDRGVQVVLLGAGMDARVYRLSCLKDSNVFEVDFPELLQKKAVFIKEVMSFTESHQIVMKAKSLIRVPADIRETDWFEKLQRCGFVPERSTIWVLEGILYYLPHQHALQVLKTIAANCNCARTVLLADFLNESAMSLSNSTFQFHSDWPDILLLTLGFHHVKLSQIGDPDAHFGLLHNPQNLFNELRNLPRSIQTHPEDRKPCQRLYMVEASGLINQDSQ